MTENNNGDGSSSNAVNLNKDQPCGDVGNDESGGTTDISEIENQRTQNKSNDSFQTTNKPDVVDISFQSKSDKDSQLEKRSDISEKPNNESAEVVKIETQGNLGGTENAPQVLSGSKTPDNSEPTDVNTIEGIVNEGTTANRQNSSGTESNMIGGIGHGEVGSGSKIEASPTQHLEDERSSPNPDSGSEKVDETNVDSEQSAICNKNNESVSDSKPSVDAKPSSEIDINNGDIDPQLQSLSNQPTNRIVPQNPTNTSPTNTRSITEGTPEDHNSSNCTESNMTGGIGHGEVGSGSQIEASLTQHMENERSSPNQDYGSEKVDETNVYSKQNALPLPGIDINTERRDSNNSDIDPQPQSLRNQPTNRIVPQNPTNTSPTNTRSITKVRKPDFQSQRHVGLRNVDNNCYLNCVIQVLFVCDNFAEEIIKYNHQHMKKENPTENDRFVEDLAVLLQSMKERCNLRTQKASDKLNRYFASQNNGDDIQKCFQQTVTKVNKVTQKQQVVSTPKYVNNRDESDRSYEKFRNRNFGFIFDLFYSQVSYGNKCESCGTVSSEHFQLLNVFPVPIPANKSVVKLSECLEIFLAKSSMDCSEEPPKCCDNPQMWSISHLTHVPKYIFIYVIRGSYVPADDKNRTMVQLDYGFYVPTRFGPVPYKLKATVDHLGGNDSGHYYAKCLHDQWMLCNDEQVEPIRWEDVESNNAVGFMMMKCDDEPMQLKSSKSFLVSVLQILYSCKEFKEILINYLNNTTGIPTALPRDEVFLNNFAELMRAMEFNDEKTAGKIMKHLETVFNLSKDENEIFTVFSQTFQHLRESKITNMTECIEDLFYLKLSTHDKCSNCQKINTNEGMTNCVHVNLENEKERMTLEKAIEEYFGERSVVNDDKCCDNPDHVTSIEVHKAPTYILAHVKPGRNPLDYDDGLCFGDRFYRLKAVVNYENNQYVLRCFRDKWWLIDKTGSKEISNDALCCPNTVAFMFMIESAEDAEILNGIIQNKECNTRLLKNIDVPRNNNHSKEELSLNKGEILSDVKDDMVEHKPVTKGAESSDVEDEATIKNLKGTREINPDKAMCDENRQPCELVSKSGEEIKELQMSSSGDAIVIKNCDDSDEVQYGGESSLSGNINSTHSEENEVDELSPNKCERLLCLGDDMVEHKSVTKGAESSDVEDKATIKNLKGTREINPDKSGCEEERQPGEPASESGEVFKEPQSSSSGDNTVILTCDDSNEMKDGGEASLTGTINQFENATSSPNVDQSKQHEIDGQPQNIDDKKYSDHGDTTNGNQSFLRDQSELSQKNDVTGAPINDSAYKPENANLNDQSNPANLPVSDETNATNTNNVDDPSESNHGEYIKAPDDQVIIPRNAGVGDGDMNEGGHHNQGTEGGIGNKENGDQLKNIIPGNNTRNINDNEASVQSCCETIVPQKCIEGVMVPITDFADFDNKYATAVIEALFAYDDFRERIVELHRSSEVVAQYQPTAITDDYFFLIGLCKLFCEMAERNKSKNKTKMTYFEGCHSIYDCYIRTILILKRVFKKKERPSIEPGALGSGNELGYDKFISDSFFGGIKFLWRCDECFYSQNLDVSMILSVQIVKNKNGGAIHLQGSITNFITTIVSSKINKDHKCCATSIINFKTYIDPAPRYIFLYISDKVTPNVECDDDGYDGIFIPGKEGSILYGLKTVITRDNNSFGVKHYVGQSLSDKLSSAPSNFYIPENTVAVFFEKA